MKKALYAAFAVVFIITAMAACRRGSPPPATESVVEGPAAPAGRVKIDENNHHAWLPAYIGRINKNCAFDIVYRSDGLIAPIPD